MFSKPAALLLLVLLGVSAGVAQIPARPLGQVDMLALRAGGVSSGRLIKFVEDRGIGFTVDGSYMHALQAAGANDELIRALTGSRTVKSSRPTAPESVLPDTDLLLQHVERGAALEQDAYHAHAVEAQAEFAAALKLDPNDPYLHFVMGSVLKRQNKKEEAASEYEEAIRLQPDFWAAHRALASVLPDAGQAIVEYRRAIALVPDDYLEHVELAQLLRKNDDVTAAEKEEKVVKRLSSSYEPARLIHKVTPHYPDALKQAGVQGNVTLGATIGIDGSIMNLRVISGDPVLAKLAVDAVRQWRYKPAYLEGDPIPLQTEITLTFALHYGR